MKKTQKKVPLIAQILIVAVIFAVGFALLAQSLKKEKNSLGVVIEDSTYPLVTIHYIDVGQGDAVFVELPKHRAMLIDAGPASRGGDVVAYIQALGYTQIDYLIGTHPHEDHIGGLPDVLDAFTVVDFYMPRVVHTTKTFENVLDAAEENGLKIQTAKAGVVLLEEDLLKAELLSPVRDDYEDLNDWSAVCRLTYDETHFLFMGDAEALAESEIQGDVSADVLKVGHHGSSTSTSEAFLERVNPSYAVISAGADNSYGHPHAETLEKLKAQGCKVCRTDTDGTIVVTSNGQRFMVETEKGK